MLHTSEHAKHLANSRSASMLREKVVTPGPWIYFRIRRFRELLLLSFSNTNAIPISHRRERVF